MLFKKIRDDFRAADKGANHAADTRQDKRQENAQEFVAPPLPGQAYVVGYVL